MSNPTSLKDVFTPKATTKSNSIKNPAYYNEEKNRCLADGACSDVAAVRMFFARNAHTPTKILTGILLIEQDKTVLRAAIMNSRMPRKAVASFINDTTDKRVEWFTGDDEMIAHFDKSE